MADEGLVIGGFISSFAQGYLEAREKAREKAFVEDRSKRQAAEWLLSNLGQFDEAQGGPGEQAAKALLSSLISPPQEAATSTLSRALPGGKGRQAKAQASGPQQGLDQFKELLNKYPLFEKPAQKPQLAELPLPGQKEPAPGQQFTAGSEGAPRQPGILKPVPQTASQMDIEKMRLEGQRGTQEMIQKDITERAHERQASEERLASERAADRRTQQEQNLDFKNRELQFRADDAKQKSLDRNLTERDRRDYQQQMLGLRKEQIETSVALRSLALQAKTQKVPVTLATRVAQAEIIKEQTASLRELMKEVKPWMGPVVGTAAPVTRLFSEKAQEFYAAQESLDALLPILHSYRGGAQTHEIFKKSMGSMRMTPQAYEGTLKALDRLADQVVGQVKQQYPDDPMWGSVGKSDTSKPQVLHYDKDGNPIEK